MVSYLARKPYAGAIPSLIFVAAQGLGMIGMMEKILDKGEPDNKTWTLLVVCCASDCFLMLTSGGDALVLSLALPLSTTFSALAPGV
jgi:hypothetical protein